MATISAIAAACWKRRRKVPRRIIRRNFIARTIVSRVISREKIQGENNTPYL